MPSHAPTSGPRAPVPARVLLPVSLLGAAAAALLSHAVVEFLWSFDPELHAERFPWGTPMTPEAVRLFEKVMGALVLGLLLVPALLSELVPWLRARRAGGR